jgi:hypothetical protein
VISEEDGRELFTCFRCGCHDLHVIHCAECDREIEFGWSHPDRGGRIWPAECADFNPWKCWPEPRYTEPWLAKGWIRPDMRIKSGGEAK